MARRDRSYIIAFADGDGEIYDVHLADDLESHGTYEYIDLEISEEDVLEKQKEEVRSKIEQMSPEELAKVQELVRGLTGGNTEAGSGSSQVTRQNSSSDKDGSSSELYPMARSSSRRMIRQNSISGLGGI